MNRRHMTLFVDMYELTMAQAWFQAGKAETRAVFDVFFRSLPDKGGYTLMAGLQSIIESIENLHFTEGDIAFLRSQNKFSEDFLAYLSQLHPTLDVYALDEGSILFPNEPAMIVHGSIIEAQLLETVILMHFNHQTLIATKASRIAYAAQHRQVVEFGARRAHGVDAALYGSRSAFIGGAVATSNVLAAQHFNIPAVGTMAHSFVQSFPSEYDAFKAYVKAYPNDSVLLIDTYSTLHSGIQNAIRAQKELLDPLGITLKGIRIDSGDLAYLSKKVRQCLDDNGMQKTQILVSNALDENLIAMLIMQGAPIDAFGVGENLITAKSEPVLGGVFKLVAIEENKLMTPTIKVSDNVNKTTTPGFKQVYRFIDLATNKAYADVVTLREEVIDDSKPYTLFDPIHPWKQKVVKDFKAIPLLNLVCQAGKRIKPFPALQEIKHYAEQQKALLWEEVLRLERPHLYYVDLSEPLWKLKQNMIESIHKRPEPSCNENEFIK